VSLATSSNCGSRYTGRPCATDGICCSAGEMECSDGGCSLSGATCAMNNVFQVCHSSSSFKAPPVIACLVSWSALTDLWELPRNLLLPLNWVSRRETPQSAQLPLLLPIAHHIRRRMALSPLTRKQADTPTSKGATTSTPVILALKVMQAISVSN
jgi:hypothetical protein